LPHPRPDRKQAASSLLLAIAAFRLLAGGALADEGGRTITVYVDQAKVVGLPREATKIILGNPSIVGVTQVPNTSSLVLTGKAFGATNLIVLDNRGAILLDTTLSVALPKSVDVVVQRAGQRSTYRCPGNCDLRLQLGDGGEVAQEAATQITTRKGLLVPGTSSAPPDSKAGGAL
jgi:Flp pilus assembly secretin CpaC